jgi:hypothetical protein
MQQAITRLLQISWLAPEIVKAIVEGRQPSTPNAKLLMQVTLPTCWKEQKALLRFE